MPAVSAPPTDTDLLLDLRRAHLAGADTTHTYDTFAALNGLHGRGVIVGRFGSWNKARAAIGVAEADLRPQKGMIGRPGTPGLTCTGRPIPTGCTAHFWTIENEEGKVVYNEFKYPPFRDLQKHGFPKRASIVRVDYVCAS